MDKRSIIGRAVCTLWALLLGWRVGMLMALALVGACSPTAPEKLPEGITRLDMGPYFVRIQEFKLEDGTRCVASSNGRGVSITCQWEAELVIK